MQRIERLSETDAPQKTQELLAAVAAKRSAPKNGLYILLNFLD